MRNYILDSDHLSKKTTDAYSMLYYMIPFLNNIEKTSKDAFEEINDHNELGNEDYTSIKGNMEHIQEYMNKYKAFGAVTNGAGQKSSSGYNYDMGTTYQSSTVGYSNNDGFIGEYQREVDDIFYYAQVNTIQKLRDSKLQDIRVNNNVGIKGEVPSSLLTMQTKMSNGIDKDKIGLEDLLGFGRISEAMHKEYEDIKAEVDAYNASLPQYSSKNSSKFLPDFISKFIFDAEIDRVKIDSYDKYINKMVTQSDFDYETDGERKLSIGGYFVPLFGQYKMLAEIVDGKDLVSGRRYSVGEQLFAISTMGAGSVIGKAYKGVKAGLASGVEETSSKIEGTVLAMNGARDSSGIEKLAKSITEKIVGKGVTKAKDYGKYSTLIDSKVKEIEKVDLPEWVGESFTDGNYRTVITEENITFYRTYGGGAKADGSFVTTTPAGNRINAKINTALVPDWKNSRQYEAVIEVPKGTTINIGRVEKQYSKTGALLAGDGDQILLPQGWTSEWIKEIKEVPSR